MAKSGWCCRNRDAVDYIPVEDVQEFLLRSDVEIADRCSLLRVVLQCGIVEVHASSCMSMMMYVVMYEHWVPHLVRPEAVTSVPDILTLCTTTTRDDMQDVMERIIMGLRVADGQWTESMMDAAFAKLGNDNRPDLLNVVTCALLIAVPMDNPLVGKYMQRWAQAVSDRPDLLERQSRPRTLFVVLCGMMNESFSNKTISVSGLDVHSPVLMNLS